MLLDTFPFLNKQLEFKSARHQYFLDGEPFDSVTRWISQYEPPFNPYLVSKQVSENPNSKYFGMDPAEIRKLWTKTGSRGTNKHSSIEKWITGKKDTCDEKDFLQKLNINEKTAWSEVPLVSVKYHLAGTADIITQIKDELIVWDIKTSLNMDQKKVDSYSLQILIYCSLLFEMSDKTKKITPGGIILIKPSSHISEGVEAKFEKPELVNINFDMTEVLKKRFKERKAIYTK